MSHTPGPWNNTCETNGRLRIDSKDYVVAYITTPRNFEWMADGKLIAASPELLDAAKIVCSLGANANAFALQLAIKELKRVVEKATLKK